MYMHSSFSYIARSDHDYRVIYPYTIIILSLPICPTFLEKPYYVIKWLVLLSSKFRSLSLFVHKGSFLMQDMHLRYFLYVVLWLIDEYRH